MSAPAYTFDAGFTVGAQLEARAQHPEVASKVLIMSRRARLDLSPVARRVGPHGALPAAPHGSDRRAAPRPRRDGAREPSRAGWRCSAAAPTPGSRSSASTPACADEILAGVLNQSRARVLVVDERFSPRSSACGASSRRSRPRTSWCCARRAATFTAGADLVKARRLARSAAGASLDAPAVDVQPTTNLMVIYTSGTTGLPKGINNNHMKLCAVGYRRCPAISASAVTTSATPACRSSTPTRCSSASCRRFWVGGSLGMRERFSASKFVPDVLRYGVTYWNYVGEPVHYVLQRSRSSTAATKRASLAEVTGNPAQPPALRRRQRRVARRHRPLHALARSRGHVRALRLHRGGDQHLPPQGRPARQRRRGDRRGGEDPRTSTARSARRLPLAPDGKILNYEQCGRRDLPRRRRHRASSRATSTTPTANASKFRDGVYHSGDLGHILVRRRTSASSTSTAAPTTGSARTARTSPPRQVARLLSEHPDVALAVAYGVPCAVSDELVMAALKLRDGAQFDPRAFFDWCERQVTGGSMDRKWFPDFVRLVDDFEFTADAEGPGAQLEGLALRSPPLAQRADLLAPAWRLELSPLHARGLREPAARVRRQRARRAARSLARGRSAGGLVRLDARNAGPRKLARSPRTRLSVDRVTTRDSCRVRATRQGGGLTRKKV